jgi:flavodoxin
LNVLISNGFCFYNIVLVCVVTSCYCVQAKVASKSSASSKTPTHVPATKFTAQTPKTLSKSPAVPGSVKASSTDGDDGPEQDIVLLDGTVRKMDGRSDRLRANLERDLDAINEKLNAPNVSLAFYDEKHFIGTSEQFKKKVATVKESLKKIRGQVVLICPRIERTKTPSHYENERKRCDDMTDRIDAAVSLLS